MEVIKDTVEAIYNDVVKNQSSTKYKINIRNELKYRCFEYFKTIGNEYLKKSMYKEASICLTEAIYHIEDDITCLKIT